MSYVDEYHACKKLRHGDCRVCSEFLARGRFAEFRQHIADPELVFVEPEFMAVRRAICETCDNRRGKTCGVLVDLGKAGILEHRKGIPNPDARCPVGRW